MNKITNNRLFEQIRNLIEQTKYNVAIAVNSSLTMMYWEIGNKINQDILNNQRAEYGKEIVATVSQQLSEQYGKGYSYSALTRMMKFAKNIDEKNIATLSQQLSWSHFKELIVLEDTLKIEFYTQMSIAQNWGVRTLRERIDSMLFERTALSKQPDELIKYELENTKQEQFSPNIILKDPYLLDFLEINDRYLEKDLEDAILRSIEQFIFELGVGFSFIERQKRIIIDGEDFKIDLLFYNRKLKRLVAIDLKIGKFKAEYKGQMELYLKWLSKYEKEEGENEPLGIILCADKKEEQIELLELEKSGIHVAQYLTVLPPREILEAKLHQAIEIAKAKYLIDNKQKDF
jgi:predicted nuclease of restriction endonuclease-like (RecB) superfamily